MDLLDDIETKSKDQTAPNNVPFPDNYSLEVFTGKNKVLYVLKDSNGYEAGKYKTTEPLMITESSNLGKEIRKHLNPNGRFSREAVQEDFERVKQVLNELYQLHQISKDREKEDQRLRNEQELKENLNVAKDLLENKDQPLLYIASLISWLTAGERVNITLTWIAYASQVILRNPINVVALGEGGSGKTHIVNTALSLIPDEYVIKEKKTTEPAFFRRSETDPYHFDGKIVDFGDLGGKSSQDFIIEIKDLLKELQTDGYLHKSLMGKDEFGEMVLMDLELFGHPCTTYTTVPGFVFDDQEMSRSIFITPRMDNKKCFHAMKRVLEFHTGKTYKKYEEYVEESKIIPYIVLLLRERMEDLIIINPYTDSIIKFLGESEYFKRDFDKYNGILKTITAINGYNRATFNSNGQDILFTNLSDIQLFISLLRAYHESISVNISPKSAEVLDGIRGNIDEWILDNKISEMGTFTVNDFFEYANSHLSKRSIQNYFGELNRAGFLKVIGSKGRANEYQLSGRVSDELLDNLLSLGDEQINLIEWELGGTAKDFICEDEVLEGLSIQLHDFDVDVPGWDRFDN